MTHIPTSDQDRTSQEILEQINELNKTISDTNSRVRRIDRSMKVSFWFKVIWFLFLIGIPFAIYYYLIEPYKDLFEQQASFSESIKNFPGWDQFDNWVDNAKLPGQD